MFGVAGERMRQAMEEDEETGFAGRPHTHLPQRPLRRPPRHDALGAARPPRGPHGRPAAPASDVLASLLHGLLHRSAATCTQHVRAACGGRAVLLWEHSRKRFDACGHGASCYLRKIYVSDYCMLHTIMHRVSLLLTGFCTDIAV